MASSFDTLEWSLIQSFLAVAETGSLSAAAQALRHSQPTLGRHVQSLETAMGVELFTRHARGLHLTETGRQLLPHAQKMRAAMLALSTAADNGANQLAGTVRIGCSVFIAHHLLPPVLTQVRQAEPDIHLVVTASDDSENLLFREADIAIRMYRPQQLDVIARQVGEIAISSFAAKSYIQRAGRPLNVVDLADHDIVGFDRSTLITDAMREMGMPAKPEDFAVRCDNQSAYWAFVRAGCGIGFTQAIVGRNDPMVEELHLGIDIPDLPVWLAAAQNVRNIPRVDRIWTLLSDALGAAIRDG